MARPRCARHPSARVWLDGTYGSNGRRRQRFKCVSANGAKHVFTEVLPRHRARSKECDECERHLARYEGVPSPRQCFYAAREIAHALARVGEGMSYRRAGAEIRQRAERGHVHPFTKSLIPSFDSSVVEDWVEVFTPVVSAPFAVKEWPPLIQLDDLPFFIRDKTAPGAKRCAFRVFAALGYDEHDQRLVYRLEAFANKQPKRWRTFLKSLSGRPVVVVCDADKGMIAGIRQAWPHTIDEPTPIIFLSHWHLQHALEKLFKAHGKTSTPLFNDLRLAFTSARAWHRFVKKARAAPFAQLHRWLDNETDCWWLGGRVSMQRRIFWQLHLPHGQFGKSNSAVEQTLRNVGNAFKGRQFAFRNRERTNRMLELIRLHQNGKARENVYARLIRDELLANGGLGAKRGVIVDPKGANSLWQ